MVGVSCSGTRGKNVFWYLDRLTRHDRHRFTKYDTMKVIEKDLKRHGQFDLILEEPEREQISKV